MLQLSNEYLVRGLETIEDLVIMTNREALNEDEMFTSVLGFYNHFFIWTKYDMTYDIKFCDRFTGGFDEDDYSIYDSLTLEEVLNIIESNN